MKTTNKILIAALVVTLVISTYFMLKISSFIQINHIEMSGIYEEKTIDIEDFERIVAKNSVIVNYVESDESKLHIEADTALFKYLVAEVKDEKLIINLDTPLPESNKALVTVFGKAPNSIKIELGAKFRTTDTINTDKLHLDMQRGAKLKINTNVDYLSCQQWEGSKGVIKGSADSLIIKSKHGSTLNAEQLAANHADISSSAGSQVFVFVTGSLSVKASEGGIVKYKGNPELKNTDIIKGGQLTKLTKE